MCWSEPASTNAPVENEAVQVILGMKQKHILPCPRFLVFAASSLPQSFSLLLTSLLLTSPLLPPSYLLLPSYLSHFILHHSIIKARESLKWEGRTRSLKQEGRSGNQKWEGRSGSQKWEGKSGNQNNALEVGAKSEKVEQELEGKLHPFSSFVFVIFLHGVVTAKKATTVCYRHLLFYVWEEEDNDNALLYSSMVLLQRKRRWRQLRPLPFSVVMLQRRKRRWQLLPSPSSLCLRRRRQQHRTIIFFWGFVQWKRWQQLLSLPSYLCLRRRRRQRQRRRLFLW